MNTSVSILAEIPEELHQSLKNYLESHPSWDQDEVFVAALSLFLLENGKNKSLKNYKDNRNCSVFDLENLFQKSNF